jgi:Flp pilus assembly protein TadB
LSAKVLSVSLQVYARLVRLYPPVYRSRFGREMTQVFQSICLDTYQHKGVSGIVFLWLSVLWDWAWTAAYQWLSNYPDELRNPMSEALDRQLGDMIWSISCGLRAAYSVRQVFEALASEAPEPAATAARNFLEALEKNGSYEAALRAWKEAIPSPSLARLAALLELHRQSGGNLADLIDPLGEELVRERGSDPAFYEPMRKQAKILGATVPERARQS